MSERAVLVTGAGGFIGAWLTRALLERGERVVALDRRAAAEDPSGSSSGRRAARGAGVTTLELLGVAAEVVPVRCDLREPGAVDRAIADNRVGTIFHLAAEPIVDAVRASPAGAFETNVGGTWNVLEAARKAGVDRVIVASSDKAYGAQRDLPYVEEMALRPAAPYEASKAAADLIARSYWPAYGLPVAVTRLANVYGGGDLSFSRLVPEVVCAALDGRRPLLRSDGSPVRDFLHVEDAARAYLAIADGLDRDTIRGEAFNAGGERPLAVAEVVELICRLAGVEPAPDAIGDGTPAGEIARQYVDATKLREATGWRAEVPLEEGLGRTIEWYRAHPAVRPWPRG